MSIFQKVLDATNAALDTYITKAKTTTAEGAERKGFVDLSYPDDEQYGWKEKAGLIGPNVLKSMARKDSIIRSIINTRLAQVKTFTKPQKDRYSEGWVIEAVEPADLSPEDKLKLADPNLDEKTYADLKYEMDQKLSKLKEAQRKEIMEICEFISHCGMAPDETDTTERRWDFDKFVTAIVEDRLTYNYMGVELVPTRDGEKLHHYYPISSGTIRYVSQRNQKQNDEIMRNDAERRRTKKRFDAKKPFRYVQILRGKVVAAFTEDELIFEPATPTIDPEDNGYAPGELEFLINIITAHLYAEAHNRNFFTQGIGTKGILHIKGDNISRSQLEAFKRQWFNQVVNSRNAFRPPIIGMAEEVKWVSLAQTNKEMEFEQWMNYLIKICCAVFQIDPAEINFDISKTGTSTLQEANNEQRLKQSRDKGLRPLLDMIENLLNNHIIRYWNKEYAAKYKFKFVGFQAESRKQELDRLKEEVQTYKTLNEVRIEMGYPPIDNGDIVLNATYTQYLAQKQAQEQAEQQMMDGGPEGGPDGQDNSEGQDVDGSLGEDVDSLDQAISTAVDEVSKELEADSKAAEASSKEETKKSQAVAIEYFIKED
jgi:hypothetical protein